MKQLYKIVAILSLLTATGAAEDPVLLGLRGAFSIFAPVPEASSYSARTTAAEALARYVKQRSGSWLVQCQGTWVESRDLKLTRVTGQAVSAADKANGIAESYLVSVDAEMFRISDRTTGGWKQWNNGRYPLMPQGVPVVLTTDGNWIARFGSPLLLTQFSGQGNPDAIPHGPKPATTSRSSSPFNTAPNRISTPAPVPSDSQSSANEAPGAAFGFLMTIFIGLVIAGLIAIVSKVRKRGGPRQQPPARQTEPSFVTPVANRPPPLPADLPMASPDPIDLIQRSNNLMTPAELAFFRVLAPVIGDSYLICPKVRLADLFDVSQSSGQQAAFNKISNKHIDFVIMDRNTSATLCGIELDDKSHQRRDRIERDIFLNELFSRRKFPLLRIPAAWTYYPKALRTELANAGLILTAAQV